MNRQERRSLMRETKGAYFVDEKRYNIAMKNALNGAKHVALQQTQIIWAAALISLKRVLGADSEQIYAVQQEMKNIMDGMETGEQLREICLSETGVDCQRLVDGSISGEDIEEKTNERERMGYIIKRTPPADRYEQLAEELVEAAHAALKIARLTRGVSPSPVDMHEAELTLMAEYGDVLACLKVLQFDPTASELCAEAKIKRWYERLNERNKGNE